MQPVSIGSVCIKMKSKQIKTEFAKLPVEYHPEFEFQGRDHRERKGIDNS